MVTASCSSAYNRSFVDVLSIPPYQHLSVPPLTTSYVPRTNPGHAVRSTTTPHRAITKSHDQTCSATMLMWIELKTPFSLLSR